MTPDSPDPAGNWVLRRRRLDSILRLQAAAVAGDPAHQEAVQLLIEALGDPVVDVREVAVAALSEFGAEARPALPELIRATQDESPVVRRRALRAIALIVDPADSTLDVVPTLLAATEDQDNGVALQAIASLSEFGPLAAPALTAFLSALWTGDARRRALAGVALCQLGAAAVPSLIQSLSHPSADVRAKSAQVLGKIGPAAAEAVPALTQLQNDRDELVRVEADAALRLMAPK